jgi:hypothetical protein
MQSLTPPERETILNWSDEEKTANIWTAQRPVITKLKANPAAELVDEGFIGTTAWAKFRFPAHLISFRSKERVGVLGSAEVQAKRARGLQKALAARQHVVEMAKRDSEHGADRNP